MKTFIFGAGASRDFFNPVLDTTYLTNKVCDQQEWGEIFPQVIFYKKGYRAFLGEFGNVI